MLDAFGNKLILETGKPYKLYLYLKDITKPRRIGMYNPLIKQLQLKRDSSKHYHYKSRTYGVNAEILSSLEIDNVLFNIDKKNYVVPIQEFNNAKYLNFNQQGFELQKFLSVDIINQYAV
jgi:hypothetical protein